MKAAALSLTCLFFFGCPPAGSSLNGGVNNVDCPPGSECEWDCNGGVCNIECLPDSVCDVTCNGGVCNLDCHPGATCSFGCNGGVCNFDCVPGSDCSTGDGVRTRSDAGISEVPDAGAGGAGGEAGAGGEGGAGGAAGEGGAGGAGGEAGAGGEGGAAPGPQTCGDLCAGISQDNLTCTQTELMARNHPLNATVGCEDLTDLEGCVACLRHLEVPDADCAAAAAACR